MPMKNAVSSRGVPDDIKEPQPARALRLRGAPVDEPAHLTRGEVSPRAIRWFGFSAFWGHLRHLVASAIATENIDSRQWMIPEAPNELLTRVLDVIGGDKKSVSLVAAKGGEVWVDFVADTGDDVSVSEAVARMVFAPYEILDDGKELILPRGDVLVLGGDLAYPVATVGEVTRRLVDPWNRVLEKVDDGKPRALLAIPGNHDWYDGLDGFARLCRPPLAFEEKSADPLHPKAHNDNLHHVLAWAEAFATGEAVKKPGSVALKGYTPVQRVSYFRFPLAEGLELWGVDRQLRSVDPRQSAFFRVETGHAARIVILPDPARAWGEVQINGVKSLESVGVDPKTEKTFVLSGDIHHYERSREGESIHVVAGGGGAFLHGGRVSPEAHSPGHYLREAEFPGLHASRGLLWQLPWHVATGKSGLLISGVFAIFDALALWGHLHGFAFPIALALGISVAIGSALLVGWRNHRIRRVVPFALATAIVIGEMPIAIGVFVEHWEKIYFGRTDLAKIVGVTLATLVATFFSGAAFGGMLALIARFGLNHAQPYAALGLPGYKCFLRLRITRGEDGAAIVDAFAIGEVDPLGKNSAPALIDRFQFRGAPSPRSA